MFIKAIGSILTILLLIITAGYKSYGGSQSSGISFENRINVINKKVVDLTWLFGLRHIQEFNEVYLNPEKSKDSVIAYLQKPELFEKKLIAFYSMTKLPLMEYASMLDSCYLLYNKNNITEELLHRFIFNEFDIKNKLVRNYSSIVVQHLLTKMLKSKLSEHFKVDIREVLNGTSYHDLKNSGHL